MGSIGGSYGALRLWSTVLIAVGIVGVVFVVIGTIVAMFEVVTFGQALAVLLIGGPLAALFASWPIALGQGLRALTNIVETVRGRRERSSSVVDEAARRVVMLWEKRPLQSGHP